MTWHGILSDQQAAVAADVPLFPNALLDWIGLAFSSLFATLLQMLSSLDLTHPSRPYSLAQKGCTLIYTTKDVNTYVLPPL
jgi:hypothetical protein